MSRISINYIISNLNVHELKLKKRAFTVVFFIKKPERTVIFVIFQRNLYLCTLTSTQLNSSTKFVTYLIENLNYNSKHEKK